MNRIQPRRLARTRALGAVLALAALVALGGAAAQAAEGPQLDGVVNINTASLDELQLLPGVGAVRAAEIVALRKQQGGFQKVEELESVRGIGPALLEKLRPHVVLTGKTTARVGASS